MSFVEEQLGLESAGDGAGLSVRAVAGLRRVYSECAMKEAVGVLYLRARSTPSSFASPALHRQTPSVVDS